MTDFRDRPDTTDHWRATIEVLEAIVLAAPDEPEIDSAEADEVRRLVMVRTARRRRDTLPAAWTRRPGMLLQMVPDAEPTPKTTGPDEITLPSPHPTARPAAGLAWVSRSSRSIA
jgi:hypothetical protein